MNKEFSWKRVFVVLLTVMLPVWFGVGVLYNMGVGLNSWEPLPAFLGFLLSAPWTALTPMASLGRGVFGMNIWVATLFSLVVTPTLAVLILKVVRKLKEKRV